MRSAAGKGVYRMRYCEKCNVKLTGEITICPLCRGPLTGEADREGNAYPDIPLTRNPYWFLVRLLALATVAAGSVSLAVNVIFPERGWWSLVVIAGLLSGWLTVGIAFKKRRRPLKSLLWQECIVSAIVFGWDYGTGYVGWSIDYVLPVLYTCMTFAMFVIARLTHLRVQDYLLYLLLNSLIGLIPAALLLAGVTRMIHPSVICTVVSVISLSALILFVGTALKDEFIRRMHL